MPRDVIFLQDAKEETQESKKALAKAEHVAEEACRQQTLLSHKLQVGFTFGASPPCAPPELILEFVINQQTQKTN